MVVSRDFGSGNVLRLWWSIQDRFALPSNLPLTGVENEKRHVPKSENENAATPVMVSDNHTVPSSLERSIMMMILRHG